MGPVARRPRRSGLNLVEVLVASALLGLIAVPLFDLFGSGLRTTHATIGEIRAANLAAELAEQLEALPFEALQDFTRDETRTLGAPSAPLRDGLPISSGFAFRLAPLPKGFTRELRLEPSSGGWIRARVEVRWTTARLRPRKVVLVRALVPQGPPGGQS